MKILSARQIREAAQHTIQNEPIASIDLMERAASRLFETIQSSFTRDTSFAIFCGKGNNGGDGLALARMLSEFNYPVQVFIVEHSDSGTEDFTENLKRLSQTSVVPHSIHDNTEIPDFDEETVLVDSLLGSGLSRPLEGLLAEVVHRLNSLNNYKIAVDISTGLFADDNGEDRMDSVFKADLTLTFQCPKMGMLHRNSAYLAGQIEVLDIGLDTKFIAAAETDFHFVRPEDIYRIFKSREKFSYKGTYGHALLIAGSYGSMGAAVMSGRAALRSGAGLLTAFLPRCGMEIFQSSLLEAMVQVGEGDHSVSGLPDLEKFKAVGIGPGLGKSEEASKTVKLLLQNWGGKMVIDADALNILSENKEWFKYLSHQTILTPHIGEFRRLLGVDNLGADYLQVLQSFSKENQLTVVLKDAITTIATPKGELYFMDYGTPALAKGGSGDVLTGIILGLLSSGYEAEDAAKLGVYLQGIAAHIASDGTSLESCLASDVIESLGEAFQTLYD